MFWSYREPLPSIEQICTVDLEADSMDMAIYTSSYVPYYSSHLLERISIQSFNLFTRTPIVDFGTGWPVINSMFDLVAVCIRVVLNKWSTLYINMTFIRFTLNAYLLII